MFGMIFVLKLTLESWTDINRNCIPHIFAFCDTKQGPITTSITFIVFSWCKQTARYYNTTVTTITAYITFQNLKVTLQTAWNMLEFKSHLVCYIPYVRSTILVSRSIMIQCTKLNLIFGSIAELLVVYNMNFRNVRTKSLDLFTIFLWSSFSHSYLN